MNDLKSTSDINRLISVRNEKTTQKDLIQKNLEEMTAALKKLSFEIDAINYSLDLLGLTEEKSEAEVANAVAAPAPNSETASRRPFQIRQWRPRSP